MIQIGSCHSSAYTFVMSSLFQLNDTLMWRGVINVQSFFYIIFNPFAPKSI
jgi:hypothetical protein